MVIRGRAQIITLLFAVCIFAPSVVVAYPSANCNRSCGGVGSANQFPFPFGFSAGCPIQFNCSANGTALIDEFPVQSLTPENIFVNLPTKCNRPVETVRYLFSRNYLPTSTNGILLQNCSTPVTGCMLPNTTVRTEFQLFNCGSSSNISCFSDPYRANGFMDYSNLTSNKCTSLYSGISSVSGTNSTAVMLSVQTVKLGWWLDGDCACSENAICTMLLSPVTGGRGYRCQCSEGFVGDGYRAGLGCLRANPACNFAKHMSGRCGGLAVRVGMFLGVVAAGVFLMAAVGLICCFIRRRSSDSKSRKRMCRRLSESIGNSIPVYSYKEIEKATHFFSEKHLLGAGAYGTVYAGKLNNDEWVAIKKIRTRDDSIEQVLNEIKLISSVSHPNLVGLLGCSIEKGEQILVYEFMPNGTLSRHLQRDQMREEGLTWPVRLAIATETAQAIAYLHSDIDPPIYHRDIKSSNILLDHNFKAKVADFGLSRLGLTESSHISTAPQGTPGYLDPQYHQNFHLSDKSDVYSFGVVLVEIITALKPVDFARSQNEVNLAALAVNKIGNGRLEEIIDPFLEHQSDSWTFSSIHKVAELAFRSLSYDRDTRPSMTEVANELEQIAASLEASSCCSLSNSGEKKLSVRVQKPELNSKSTKSVFALLIENSSMNPMDGATKISPDSVQDSWSSLSSSPSSSSTFLAPLGQ